MSVTRPRGRLPARVYWTRRVLVLGVAFALVLGVTRLVGAVAGAVTGAVTGGDPEPAAGPGSVESPSGSPSALSTIDVRARDDRESGKRQSGIRTPPAQPSGPCQDGDVKVVPALAGAAYAGSDVRLTLKLSTFESPACNWEISAETLAVRLSSGSDRVWSSQQCPNAVPEEAVVLRDRKPVVVDVIWSGRRSDPDCSRSTRWAEPGYYHVSAAAMGSEPESQQFRLLPPAPVTITPSPTSKPKANPHGPEGSGPSTAETTRKPRPRPAGDA